MNGYNEIRTESVRKFDPQNSSDYALLSQMATAIADEIRNPLAGIASTVSLLKAELRDALDSEKMNTIDLCIQRIDSFVENLYLLTRPVNPGFVKIDITGFLEQVVLHYFQDTDYNYTFQSCQKRVFVMVDMVLMQNAITNILENAIDAIKQKSGEINIKVDTTENNENVQIIIQDNGIGIEQAVLPNLFTPFFSTKHEGRGLGLVITRNYVHCHNGTIQLTSEFLKGTQVSIKLPVYPGGDQDAGTRTCIGSRG